MSNICAFNDSSEHRLEDVCRCLMATVVVFLLTVCPDARAWQGPFSLQEGVPVVTDKPLIAVNSYTCHASGGFAFRVASESKFKRIGKLRFKFLDSNGNDVGSVASAYRLQPKSEELIAKYSPCLQAAAFSVRHEPI